MKTAKLTMMTTLMALMLLAVGCKKENENTAERQQNNSTPMLQFNSFDEVIDYLVDEKKNKSNNCKTQISLSIGLQEKINI